MRRAALALVLALLLAGCTEEPGPQVGKPAVTAAPLTDAEQSARTIWENTDAQTQDMLCSIFVDQPDAVVEQMMQQATGSKKFVADFGAALRDLMDSECKAVDS